MKKAHFSLSRCALWLRQSRSLLLTALLVFAVRSSLADWNDVPTGSMKPTILEGDRVWVNRLAYDLKVPFTTWHLAEWGQPQRGDVVVFYSPADGTRLIKRVVGLPGDTVELRNNILIINGKEQHYSPLATNRLFQVEPAFLNSHPLASEDLTGHPHAVAAWPSVPARRSFGPVQVPANQYFVMGDNRDDSFDSRYYGAVERSRILGRASTVVLSLDRQRYWLPRLKRTLVSLQS